MRTKDLLIVMGTLGSTFVLLYGWPTLHRYEQTVDGRLVRISRVTHETRLLEEGRGWVKANQASPVRSNYCPSSCPDKGSLSNSWQTDATILQPKNWTLSKQQQKQMPRPSKSSSQAVGIRTSATELDFSAGAKCSCQRPGFLWRIVKTFFH